MTQLPEAEEMDPPEADMEVQIIKYQSQYNAFISLIKKILAHKLLLQTWSVEELRKRSKELNLLEVAELVVNAELKGSSPNEKKENDRSPSKSSNSGSQVSTIYKQVPTILSIVIYIIQRITKTLTFRSLFEQVL